MKREQTEETTQLQHIGFLLKRKEDLEGKTAWKSEPRIMRKYVMVMLPAPLCVKFVPPLYLSGIE